MALKAVIFDMDGIIIDSEPLQMIAFNEMLKRYRISFTTVFFKTLIGINSRENLRQIRETFGLKETVEDLGDEKDRLYHRQLDFLLKFKGEKAANPGIVSLIKELYQNGILLAVASSSPGKEIEHILTNLNIKPYFHTLAAGDEVARSKPSPDVFLLALERLGVQKHQVIVIEDSAPGVKAARAAGIKCIAVPSIYTEGSDFFEADSIVEGTHCITLNILRSLFPVQSH